MSTNYNASQVGVPYVRCSNITISYGPNQIPVVVVHQDNAVVLADGTVATLGPVSDLNFTLDLVNNATTPIPLVDPTSGAALGPDTTLQQLMLGILAVIRQQQIIQNP